MKPESIPSWQLYGEQKAFPDVMHCEKITDRAAGLDWTIAPHRHAHLHQFFAIRTGGLEISVEGETLFPDVPCVVSIPSGTVHGFAFSADTDGFVLTIPLQNLPEVFSAPATTGLALSRFAILLAPAEIVAIFDALHAEHEARNPSRTILLRAYAAMIAVLVSREVSVGIDPGQREPGQLFRHFEDLVLAHFRQGWRLGDYATAIGVSTRHLGRLCQSAAGKSPSEFIAAVQMQEACRLLVYTRDTIAAIGYQLGFEDPAYFSRVFRSHLATSPSAYRAKFEQE